MAAAATLASLGDMDLEGAGWAMSEWTAGSNHSSRPCVRVSKRTVTKAAHAMPGPPNQPNFIRRRWLNRADKYAELHEISRNGAENTRRMFRESKGEASNWA